MLIPFSSIGKDIKTWKSDYLNPSPHQKNKKIKIILIFVQLLWGIFNGDNSRRLCTYCRDKCYTQTCWDIQDNEKEISFTNEDIIAFFICIHKSCINYHARPISQSFICNMWFWWCRFTRQQIGWWCVIPYCKYMISFNK